MTRRLPLLVLLLLACATRDSLDGSLGEAFDLGFKDVVVRQAARALQVSYLKSDGNEVVLKLTVATDGLALEPGKAIDLAGEYAPGHPRATLVRAVDGEPLRRLPPVAHGELVLDAAPVVGQPLSGEFSLAFGEGGDVGSGRNVKGSFTSTVRAAE